MTRKEFKERICYALNIDSNTTMTIGYLLGSLAVIALANDNIALTKEAKILCKWYVDNLPLLDDSGTNERAINCDSYYSDL